jgi:protein phosphatase
VVLASDAFRAAIAGDEADQRATRPAFAILHREVARRLGGRRLTVVDATNVQGHARRALVRMARTARVPVVAIVLDLPAGVVLGRNASRVGRVVSREIVIRQLADLRRSLAPGGLDAEGFDAVHVIGSASALDTVRIAIAGATTGDGG